MFKTDKGDLILINMPYKDSRQTGGQFLVEKFSVNDPVTLVHCFDVNRKQPAIIDYDEMLKGGKLYFIAPQGPEALLESKITLTLKSDMPLKSAEWRTLKAEMISDIERSLGIITIEAE